MGSIRRNGLSMFINKSDSFTRLSQSNNLIAKKEYLGSSKHLSKVIDSVLKDIGLDDLLEYLVKIPILYYDFYFKTIDNEPIYSFLVYDGFKGYKIKDKTIYDRSGNLVLDYYELPINAPFIVIGAKNSDSIPFIKSSIIHEIAHLIYLICQDDNKIDLIMNNMPELNHIDLEEAYSIFLECKLLLSDKNNNTSEIMNYLTDRYLINLDEEDKSKYITDLQQILSIC